MLDILKAIEDKLYERDVFMKVMGDSENDVTISFKVVAVGNEQVPALVIAVTTTKAHELNAAGWEGLSDYVKEEFLQFRPLLWRNILNVLDQSCGQHVTLNGKTVY